MVIAHCNIHARSQNMLPSDTQADGGQVVQNAPNSSASSADPSNTSDPSSPGKAKQK